MTNRRTTPLLITRKRLAEDPNLQPDSRGARKICVTTLFDSKEHLYSKSEWFGSSESTPVLLMENTELAVFTQTTVQDRHFHKNAHEFYSVLDGEFRIEIEGELYELNSGDTIIVPPGAVHEVLRETSFTTQVITVNTNGLEDKVVVNR